MPWKESNKVSERIKFIFKLLNGSSMTDVCREFGVSRVTGYKIFNRYKQEGLDAMKDRISAPWRVANKTSMRVESLILQTKDQFPTWGAPKILAYLEKRNRSIKFPAKSTVHAILERNGKVKRRRKNRSFKAKGSYLRSVHQPNDLWCADFKGQFRLGSGHLCYPLTITDQHSRFLLGIEALESVRERQSIECFVRTFKEFGLPQAIRTDNGVPFAARSLFGLSKLSVFWLRLGIELERIEPGHPEQNGRHERMHRTLKAAATKPAGENILHQQEMFDTFQQVYNFERPHEALQMASPSEFYKKSTRQMPAVLDEIDYSGFTYSPRVSRCGCIRMKGSEKIFISDVFAGQYVGVKEADDGVWSINFMNYTLGFFDFESSKFSAATNPFFN